MTSLRHCPHFLSLHICCRVFSAADFSSTLRSLLFLGRTHSMRTLERQEAQNREHRPHASQALGRCSIGFPFSSQNLMIKRRYLNRERNVIAFFFSDAIIPVFSTGISLIITGVARCWQLLRENFLRSEKFSFQIAISYLTTAFLSRLDISVSSTSFITETISHVPKTRIKFSTS